MGAPKPPPHHVIFLGTPARADEPVVGGWAASAAGAAGSLVVLWAAAQVPLLGLILTMWAVAGIIIYLTVEGWKS